MDMLYAALLDYAIKNDNNFERFETGYITEMFPNYNTENLTDDLVKLKEQGKIDIKIYNAGIRAEKTGKLPTSAVLIDTIRIK